MERMTGLDAGFLYMETPSLHMHTLKIATIDPSTMPGGYTFERVKEELANRLHLLPPFRRRAVFVPFGLHHPMWIEDPDFDLEWHVHRVAAPAPGGPQEFASIISDVASHQLDRHRPLWEIWVVEGLADGTIGFVTKLHHALADGVVAAELLVNVLDAEQSVPTALPPVEPWVPERVPTKPELVVHAFVDRVRELAGLPGLLHRTVAGLRRARRHRKAAEVSPPLPFAGPKTAFNRALTPHRQFTMTSVPLGDVKRVKDAFGVTVNDVVLGMCAGALRLFLAERGQLPARPLVAGVPVALAADPDAAPRLQGNSVSNLFTVLRTDLADPVARLHAISRVTKEAKAIHQEMGAELLRDWSEITPGLPFAAWMRLYSRLGLASRHRPPINLVASNVPGPREPLYVAGGRLAGLWSVGPILEGIGLNITVWSYLDQLNAGLLACPEHLPDLWRLTGLLPVALDELVAAAAETVPA